MKINALVAAVAVTLGAGVALAATASAEPAFPRDWDYSQTRSAGHYHVAGDTLHVWTDDASSQAKVAGYRPVNTTLHTVGTTAPEPTLSWVGTTPQPGFQLVITAGGKSRILVGEPVYGFDWWMSDASCDTWCDTLDIDWRGGGGSAHSAQLNEWAAGVPGATVTHIGFSLGSGVKGDGTIHHLSFLGKTYGFQPYTVPTKPTVIIPPVTGTATSTPPTTTTTSRPIDPPTETQGAIISTTRSIAPTSRTSAATPRAQARAFDDRSLASTGVNDVWWIAGLGVLLVLVGGIVVALRVGRRG